MTASRSVLLAACPTGIDDENREALARAEARQRRDLAIWRAENRCGKCGWFAWSFARRDQLELRPKEPVAGKPSAGDWVLCPACAAGHDKKKAKRGRAK